MRKSYFWVLWGIASLVCVFAAGYKSFAIDLEKEKANKPIYIDERVVNSVLETDSASE